MEDQWAPWELRRERPPAVAAEGPQRHEGAEAAPERGEEAHDGLAVNIPEASGTLQVSGHLRNLRDGAHNGEGDRLARGLAATLAHRPAHLAPHRGGARDGAQRAQEVPGGGGVHGRATVAGLPDDDPREDSSIRVLLEGVLQGRTKASHGCCAVGRTDRLVAVKPVHPALKPDEHLHWRLGLVVIGRPLRPRSKNDEALARRDPKDGIQQQYPGEEGHRPGHQHQLPPALLPAR
mmetsp:Transcript_135266/g.420353  ORF Transcript_135266/g.420353 Transcript_135266/m.420353 type:complete len:235 (+) Transcript_135266:398-1102(+)